MIELTNADYEKIREVCSAGHRSGTYPMIADEREAIYRAGLAAGIERSMEACDRESKTYQDGPPRNLRADVVHIGRAACWGCAAAIRLLNAHATP